MRILGIDPGYDRVGWAIIEKEKGIDTLLCCDCIYTDKKAPLYARLLDLSNQLETIITQYGPTIGVIEQLFFATNAKTAIQVAQARGVILLVCAKHTLHIKEYTPLQIKLAIAGNGKADKKAVEKMVRLILPTLSTNLIDDTIDSIAMALCYKVNDYS